MLKGTFILIKAKPKGNKPLSAAVAGDLLCYDNDKLYIYPSSKFEGTPIGVVVIPTSHNVYGNGSCGVMSLVNMSCQTPDTGTTEDEKMCLGYGYNHTIICNDIRSYINSSRYVVAHSTWLPSNKFNGLQYLFNSKLFYYSPYMFPDEGMNQGLSPYNEDESLNSNYANLNGEDTSITSYIYPQTYNTNMLNNTQNQPNWKTDKVIINSSEEGYNTAACCCWRYYTEGTSQGQWYLPSLGELGYIMSKFNEINNTTKIINDSFQKIRYLWSSCYNNDETWYLEFSEGLVTTDGNQYDHTVRAFMQVGPDIVSE